MPANVVPSQSPSSLLSGLHPKTWLSIARRELGALWTSMDGPARGFLLLFSGLQLLLCLWDLPGGYGWENDGVAPRDFFGGIANNLLPGKTHRYPLLHYFLLGLLSLPVLLVDTLLAWVTQSPVQQVVTHPWSMSAIALGAKVLHIGISAVGLAAAHRIWRTLFSSSVALWALLFMTSNMTVAYYGRSTNVDTVYLAWSVLALDRLLLYFRVPSAHHLRCFAFLVAAALASKDQAYAVFVLVGPLYLVAGPLLFGDRWSPHGRGAKVREHFPRLLRAAGLGLVFYLVLSGALLNPTGFIPRLQVLVGPNSQDWRSYPKTLDGVLSNLQDLFSAQSEFFWPWLVVAVVWGGFFLAVRGAGARRSFRYLPFVAGLSSTLFFTLVVARAEHRFLLVWAYWFSGYGGVLMSRLVAWGRRWAPALPWVWGGLSIPALGFAGNLELAMTQLYDPRKAVEAWLLTLPEGSRVETYGLGVYLPRFALPAAAPYAVQRVSAPNERKPPAIVGIEEYRGNYLDLERRQPEVLVAPEGFVSRFRHKEQNTRAAAASYRKAEGAMPFFTALLADELPGYHRLPVGQIAMPDWYSALGGRAVAVHGSTASPVWVFVRDAGPKSDQLAGSGGL